MPTMVPLQSGSYLWFLRHKNVPRQVPDLAYNKLNNNNGIKQISNEKHLQSWWCFTVSYRVRCGELRYLSWHSKPW
ncbi:hypothetical protein OH492_14130 [Vibrio chagasii]|nr:hypothetical protein [Vibrio chagasii]